MEKHHHERSTFSGKLGFVLSAAGASVGLGNIWRFPYLAAKYGGGIFLLIYIILALIQPPKDSHLDLPNFPKAPTGLFLVIRPRAVSATIIE